MKYYFSYLDSRHWSLCSLTRGPIRKYFFHQFDSSLTLMEIPIICKYMVVLLIPTATCYGLRYDSLHSNIYFSPQFDGQASFQIFSPKLICNPIWLEVVRTTHEARLLCWFCILHPLLPTVWWSGYFPIRHMIHKYGRKAHLLMQVFQCLTVQIISVALPFQSIR